MPLSSDPVDLMMWDQQNYGYHILILGRLIPDGSHRLANLIGQLCAAAQSGSQTMVVPEIISAHGPQPVSDASPDQRLRTILELRAQGLLSAEEYEQKRKEILSSL
jgi:Short C-terminal domain